VPVFLNWWYSSYTDRIVWWLGGDKRSQKWELLKINVIYFLGKEKLVYAVVGLWVFHKMTGGMQVATFKNH
jgi:hypothetical protein